MAVAYVLFNPLAGNGKCKKDIEILPKVISDRIVYCNITQYQSDEDYASLITHVNADAGDYIIICGGDGTLNRFANLIYDMDVRCDIKYFPGGSGNDFANDIGCRGIKEPFSIKEYLVNLPEVTVKGHKSRFINGIGFGIDGYCCEEGDKLRKKTDKRINYTPIAIKGLLFFFKPTGAKVTIDGKVYHYKKVWMAPTMNGRYFGGGMMATPGQDRKNPDGSVSVMILHDCSKFRILKEFPKVFKGKHVSLHKLVDIYQGHEVKIEFDRPTALQIDGETVTAVTSYSVRSRKFAKSKAAEMAQSL